MSLPWAHPLFRAVSGGEWHPGGAAATERLWRACRAALTDGPGHGTDDARDAARPLQVLDAGCGEGAAALRLAAEGERVVALDRTPRSGWRLPPSPAAGAARPLFCAADIRHIPLRDGWADVVLCQCVASLLPRPESFLTEAVRVLRPGGVLGFSDLVRRDEAESRPADRDTASIAPGSGRPSADTSVVSLSGGCAAGARRREEWEGLLRTAGLRLLSFSDESRELARLTARLVWYGDGESLRQLGLDGAADCRSVCRKGSRPGYGVWVAVNARQTI